MKMPLQVTDVNRRQFLAVAAGSTGLAAVDPRLVLGRSTRRDAAADAVIQVFLRGGMSHLDSFDPKPEATVEVRSPFGAVAAKGLGGERFAGLLRQTSQVADRLVVLRGVGHTEAAHERGTHTVLTGNKPNPALTYPSIGAVISHELGPNGDLPPYVCVPNVGDAYLGSGYLGSAFGPFSLGSDPASRNFRVRDLDAPRGVHEARVARRRALLDSLDGGVHAPSAEADAVRATAKFRESAWRLIASEKAAEAFAIDKESGKIRDRYGRNGIGQRLLMARRLVEAGVRFVSVVEGGWDHHRKIASLFRRKMPNVDRGFAALVSDLDERGLLERTLVVLTTEFGRTPRLNADGGRDHWSRASSIALAGGGLKRGIVLGATDGIGGEPVDQELHPADVAATIFDRLGIDPRKRLLSPGDRPVDLVRDGRVLRELFA